MFSQQLNPGRHHPSKPANKGGTSNARCSHFGGEELRVVEEENSPGEGDAHLAKKSENHGGPVVGEHPLRDEDNGEERETTEEDGEEVGNSPTPVEEEENGRSVGRDLQQARDGEVEVDVGSSSQSPHVERQAVVGEGVDEPVVVEDESLRPHVPVPKEVQDCPPLQTAVRALDGLKFEVSWKLDIVIFSSRSQDLLGLLYSAHGEQPARALWQEAVHEEGEEAGQGGVEHQLPPVPEQEGQQSQGEPARHPDKHGAQTHHRVPLTTNKLQHVGEERLEDGDDEEGIENSADNEANIVRHLRSEDTSDGHSHQQGNHHSLPAVNISQDSECEDPEHHAYKVQGLGQRGQVVSAADETELACYRRYKVSLVEFPFITGSSLRTVGDFKFPFVVIFPVYQRSDRELGLAHQLSTFMRGC